MAAKPSLTLKLLIDTEAKRVLFAEASNDFVDFLFHILSLPVATVTSLLKNQGMVGSLANLYKSVERLHESYLQPNRSKDVALKPAISQPYGLSVPLLELTDSSEQRAWYRCSGNQNHSYVSDDPRAACPSCGNTLSCKMTYVAPAKTEQQGAGEEGFVKGLVSYMVMDNMEVSPMSTVSCIALLNKFKVKDVGCLEERVIDLGVDEAISLLKAFLQSETVLTDVFLKGK